MPSRARRLVFACALFVAASSAGCGSKEEAERLAKTSKAIADATPKVGRYDAILADAAKRPVVVGTQLKLPKAADAGFLYLDKDDDPGQGSLAPCSDLVKKSAVDAQGSLPVLERCAKASYAIVMHKRSISAPTPSPYDNTFNPGIYDGDAYVYSLDSGEYVGAFEVRSLSSASQKVGGPDAEAKLKKDLMTNAEKAATTKFSKAAPE